MMMAETGGTVAGTGTLEGTGTAGSIAPHASPERRLRAGVSAGEFFPPLRTIFWKT